MFSIWKSNWKTQYDLHMWSQVKESAIVSAFVKDIVDNENNLYNT